MHVTMVKKRLRDGSECAKCGDATARLRDRGLLDRIDETIWAVEDDPESPGSRLASRLGVDRAPFFVVREDDGRESVYTSVLKLIRERFGANVSDREEVAAIDPDDVGGI
ncbi:MAG TPA: hypothetical protein VFD92_11645 [Candidatus Binatia bacterium]|nr:hypothetical protein [Candidatus Binatia bacterium]